MMCVACEFIIVCVVMLWVLHHYLVHSCYCEVVRMMFSAPKNNSALFDSRDCLPGLDLVILLYYV